MWIEVRDGGEVALLEADDFTRLSVKLFGAADPHAGRRTIERIGLVVGPDHVYVEPQLLLSLAGAKAGDAAWRAQFDGMLAYAQSKGWTDESGRVQIHIEQVQDG